MAQLICSVFNSNMPIRSNTYLLLCKKACSVSALVSSGLEIDRRVRHCLSQKKILSSAESRRAIKLLVTGEEWPLNTGRLSQEQCG